MQKQKSFLLKTSSSADVQSTNGNIIIGNVTIKKSLINSIKHKRYKTEIQQVYTVGAAYSPTTGTRYALGIGSVERYSNSVEDGLNLVTFITPETFPPAASTDALRRDIINTALVTYINNNTSVLGVTAALVAGSGNGFTITDVGGYYGARTQGATPNFGASEVILFTNPDGTGFVDANDKALTTSAIYEFGTGSILAADKAAYDQMFMYIPSGTPEGSASWRSLTPTAADGTIAVSGQNYDAVLISCNDYAAIELANNDSKMVLQSKEVWIFVDNGTGSSTTNLAGYKDFIKAIHKIIAKFNDGDNSTYEFFDDLGVFQGAAGAVPSGTLGATNVIATSYGQLSQFIVGGAATIITPTAVAGGWNIENDATATEGSEIVPPTYTNKSFTVGKDEFSYFGWVSAADYTKIKWTLGFHEKGAPQATYSSYTKLAAIDLNAGVIGTDGGAAYNTASSDSLIANQVAWVEIKVKIDGTVTAKVNGKTYPINSASSTPLVLAAGSVVVPFERSTNVGSSTATPVISEIIAIENIDWLE